MLDTNGNHINKMSKNKTDNVYNLPEKEAYINTYLNNTWINSLNIDIRNIIETHYFNVGPIYILEDTLSDNINYEKRYKWQGKIGLMSAIDFIKASSSDTCAGGKFYSSTDCLENNYLYNLGELTRTITPSIASSNAYDVITVHNYIHNRALGPDGARNKRTIAPTFYLSKDIKLQGTGEKNNPFTILN